MKIPRVLIGLPGSLDRVKEIRLGLKLAKSMRDLLPPGSITAGVLPRLLRPALLTDLGDAVHGWRLNHFPGQPGPMLDNPLGEEKFPNIQSKPPLAQLEAISSRPITCYLGEETDPHLSTPSFQAKQSQLPQLLPISLVLQTLHQLSCPSLDTLQPLNVSLVVRGPKLNTGFEVRPHQCRVQGHNHCPTPAGHTIFDTSQDAIGFLGCLGKPRNSVNLEDLGIWKEHHCHDGPSRCRGLCCGYGINIVNIAWFTPQVLSPKEAAFHRSLLRNTNHQRRDLLRQDTAQLYQTHSYRRSEAGRTPRYLLFDFCHVTLYQERQILDSQIILILPVSSQTSTCVWQSKGNQVLAEANHQY
ncbi:hypothetical protein QYF61_021117 [Mycteria americana]|uniref:Uncharacterized protein n=1 Tax=Mycteria americana TaxID=33587 RepID=A0AAN7N6P8_MYCAM|nr:hypothetical protein QYF61_021117 [Mycteria americana]